MEWAVEVEDMTVAYDERPVLWDVDMQHKRIREAYGPASIFAGSYGWFHNTIRLVQ